jgi:hypothetical protein
MSHFTKHFTEASELEVAGLVLQKGTDYVTHFGQQKNSFVSADAKDVRGLEAEYYVLRTALVRCVILTTHAVG